jgi:hypothetical protein
MAIDLKIIDLSPVDIVPVDIATVDIISFWTTPADIPSTEAAALKAFYDATGGAGWTTKTNWGTAATAANWYGVTVAGGHVTKIELNSNGLTGNAGTTLAPLAAVLLTLKVGGTNALTGITVTALTALTTLDTSNCTLTQAQVDAVLLMLDTAEKSGGTVTISGNNAAPSASGLAYATSLQQKTWTVTTSATVTLSETLTAGALKMAIVNGGAMLFRDGKDYSPYAGTDAGSTPYLIEMCDSAGKVAYAYAGAVGAGAALGGELLTNGSFDGAWGANDLPAGHSIFGTPGANNYLQKDDANDRLRIYSTGSIIGARQFVVSIGALYQMQVDIQSVTSGGVYIAVDGASVFSVAAAGVLTDISCASGISALLSRNSTADVLVNSWSIQKYNDVAATGLHLMSAKNGTTRNMGYVENGFNPNLITLLRVYPAP